jgi:biopolymer transport protein ExbB
MMVELMLIATTGAPAGAPSEAAAAASSAGITSIWNFIERGGILMWPIGLCSILVIAIIVERLITLRRRSVIPPRLVADLKAALDKGDVAEARTLAEASKSPIASIAAVGLQRAGRPNDEVEKAVTDAGLWEVRRLRKNVRGLQVVGAIAPLLGLLGTIFGMIQAFQTVATSAEALGKTELLAKGIYEAMITTAAGLIVAIPAVIGYHLISGRIEGLVAEMDRICVDLVERVGQRNGSTIPSVAAAVKSARESGHTNGVAAPGGAAPRPTERIEPRAAT